MRREVTLRESLRETREAARGVKAVKGGDQQFAALLVAIWYWIVGAPDNDAAPQHRAATRAGRPRSKARPQKLTRPRWLVIVRSLVKVVVLVAALSALILLLHTLQTLGSALLRRFE